LEGTPRGRRPRPRIETLADLIFGLSLSIGSIALISSPPTSAGEIGSHIAAFAHVISTEEKKLVEPALAALFRNGRNRMAILTIVMAASVAPQFWEWTLFTIPIWLYVWYLPLVSYWLGRAIRPESRSYTLERR
jgi:hypothetical protein